MAFVILGVIEGISFLLSKSTIDIETFFFIWCFIPFAFLYFGMNSGHQFTNSPTNVMANVDIAVSKTTQEKRIKSIASGFYLKSAAFQYLLLGILNIIVTIIIYNIKY
ncbi:MAG: hypothetical protein JEZ08_22930 [Clostridiales bacterium]|nr:hypothetical protein [Clostridiales bacterium]